MTAIAMLFTECKKKASFEDLVSIKNADQAQEVTFEDMATNIRIVPLVSDEPIDGLSNMKCYGSTTIYYSVNGFIYVFEDGKQVAKLDKKGRGRGEYTLITDYVYSPSSKVLSIIDAFTTIHKYSVPEMQYLASVSIDGMAMSMAEHDDSTLLCRMVPKDVEKTAICFVSSNTGRVRKIHKDSELSCDLSCCSSPSYLNSGLLAGLKAISLQGLPCIRSSEQEALFSFIRTHTGRSSAPGPVL